MLPLTDLPSPIILAHTLASSRPTGPKLFDLDDGKNTGKAGTATTHFTLIFNTFVLMQIFNEINARKVHGERSVFSGIHTNPIFLIIFFGTLGVQVRDLQWEFRGKGDLGGG